MKTGQRRAQMPERFACPDGWVRNRSLMAPGPTDAAVLTNFFPTATGARARGGSTLYATLDAAVTHLATHSYRGADTLFAATAESIYDITSPGSPGTPEVPLLTAFSSGEWATQEFSTSGGGFTWWVNGTDNAALFNGTSLVPITDQATNALNYDALVTDFETGETVTGGTSGATAEIVGIRRTTATAGTLYIGTVTGGPFQNNEALTSASGSATADGTVSVVLANTISGIEGSALSHVWTHGRRLWFVEEDTLSAWYLGPGAISGTLTEFPLDGVVSVGAVLMFGGRLSTDANDGMDDFQVFVTSEGEVAIYAGTDPSSANTWALQGVYKIPRPLSKRAHARVGGDLWIATEAGLFSMLDVLSAQREQQVAVALTFDIEDFWQDAVAARSTAVPFALGVWYSRTYLLIGIPGQADGQPLALVLNTATRRWALYVGWDARTAVVHDDQLYFGTQTSLVLSAETGGTDNGDAYYSTMVPMFRSGAPNLKYAHQSRVVYKGAGTPLLTILEDFDSSDIPLSDVYSISLGSLWGTAVWGTGIWGSPDDTVGQEWQATPGYGFSFSPALAVGWGSAANPSFEPAAIEVLYELGREI